MAFELRNGIAFATVCHSFALSLGAAGCSCGDSSGDGAASDASTTSNASSGGQGGAGATGGMTTTGGMGTTGGAGGSGGVVCAAGTDDCDGDPENGCEADLTAPSTCGACDVDCDDADPCTSDTCDARSACAYAYADTAACKASWTQVSPGASPPALVWPGMAYDAANEEVILFGGMDPNSGAMSDETWAWDGSTWTQLTPAQSPPGRFTHGMVYDAALQRIVAFGGLTSGLSTNGLDDTWAWDGATWTLLATPDSPGGRGVHDQLAFDAVRDRVVLFGGGSQPGASTFTDVWELDGSTWTQVATAAAPPTRVAGCLVFDGQTTTLFGGGLWNPYFDDTWTWDGSAWSELSPATSPPARQSHRCAWDSWRERVVMFGGDASGALSDTWELAGGAWSAAAASGPTSSCCGGLAFDSVRHETVIFTMSGETWTYGPP